MPSGGILLKYQGAMTEEVIHPLLMVVQHRLECIEPDINLQKKVYSIMMECAQNIYLHADSTSGNGKLDTSLSHLSLESNKEGYSIISANFVCNGKRTDLINILENINNLKTPQELKNLYNNVMINKSFSSKGGGGLGLIDVARKTTGKLNYTFDNLINDYSFFTLHIEIKKK